MKNKKPEAFEKLLNPNIYQVFLFACPAPVPFHFAMHPWFVVNKKGVYSRWEVLQSTQLPGTHWGYLYTNALSLFQETVMFLHTNIFWNGRKKLLGSIEGGENSPAHRLAEFLEHAPETYPHSEKYFLPGPNSNTFAAWVLAHAQEFKVELPGNAFGKNYGKKEKIKNGVVHGRFQPPHNGHIRYMLCALERAEHLTIGICTPKICTPEEAAKTGYPCTAALNPFSYEERKDMIELALAEAGVAKERYTCIPCPSDYKNIKTLLPENAVFLMSVTGEGDTKKVAYLHDLGFGVETVFTIPPGNPRERSGAIRHSAHHGKAEWEESVPKSIADYIKKHRLVEKMVLDDTMLK